MQDKAQNNPALEEAVKKLIESLGENVVREGLSATPRRVAKAFEKMFSGPTNPKKY